MKQIEKTENNAVNKAEFIAESFSVYEEVLEIGAGHLEGSSLPVGGESTHAVISAHRGLPSATLFTDLTSWQRGIISFCTFWMTPSVMRWIRSTW